MSLTIDQAVGIEDAKVERVEVPEWGPDAVVCLRPCPSADWDEHEARIFYSTEAKDAAAARGYRSRLVAACWCDENGKRANPSPKQVALLGTKSPVALQRLYEAARRVCTQIEVAEKN